MYKLMCQTDHDDLRPGHLDEHDAVWLKISKNYMNYIPYRIMTN